MPCKIVDVDQLIFTLHDAHNSFSSTDLKFCSCSDDTTVKVWDFARCQEERSLTGKDLTYEVEYDMMSFFATQGITILCHGRLAARCIPAAVEVKTQQIGSVFQRNRVT